MQKVQALMHITLGFKFYNIFTLLHENSIIIEFQYYAKMDDKSILALIGLSKLSCSSINWLYL